jgi:hypothetical protein
MKLPNTAVLLILSFSHSVAHPVSPANNVLVGLMFALGMNGKVDCVNFYTELGWCTLAFSSNMFAVCTCNPLSCFCGCLIEHFAQVMDLSFDQERKPDFEFMDKDDMLLLMDKPPHQKSANSK